MKKGRVIEEHKTNYIISDGSNELTATVRGAFFTDETFPKVGDYVLYEEVGDDKAVIEEIEPRSSTVARKSAHTGDMQIIVANVDVIFIVMGLDNDFNLSRLERYLLLANQSEVEPVVVLNKCDQVEEYQEYVVQVQNSSPGTSVHAVSALTGYNMPELLTHITPDTTVVLLGSSGAGKSTITNWLLATDTQAVNDVRTDDSKGKHTTTSRQLFTLPSLGYLIDTPGMRELSVIESASEHEDEVFGIVEELASQCRFSNCDHEKSMGCAVVAGIEAGDITARQLQNYLKLKRERLFEVSKQDVELSRQQKQKQKKLHKSYGKAQQKKLIDREF